MPLKSIEIDIESTPPSQGDIDKLNADNAATTKKIIARSNIITVAEMVAAVFFIYLVVSTGAMSEPLLGMFIAQSMAAAVATSALSAWHRDLPFLAKPHVIAIPTLLLTSASLILAVHTIFGFSFENALQELSANGFSGHEIAMLGLLLFPIMYSVGFNCLLRYRDIANWWDIEFELTEITVTEHPDHWIKLDKLANAHQEIETYFKRVTNSGRSPVRAEYNAALEWSGTKGKTNKKTIDAERAAMRFAGNAGGQ